MRMWNGALTGALLHWSEQVIWSMLMAAPLLLLTGLTGASFKIA